MKPYVFIGFLVFLLAVVGKHFLLNQPTSLATLALQTPCNLRQAPCVASDTAGHSIRFSISPTSIPLMQELTLKAETSGWGKVHSARLTVAGVNMFMGYQYADLTAGADGVLQGKLVLPVCTLETMQWQATLLAQTDTGQVSAAFPFETAR